MADTPNPWDPAGVLKSYDPTAGVPLDPQADPNFRFYGVDANGNPISEPSAATQVAQATTYKTPAQVQADKNKVLALLALAGLLWWVARK